MEEKSYLCTRDYKVTGTGTEFIKGLYYPGTILTESTIKMTDHNGRSMYFMGTGTDTSTHGMHFVEKEEPVVTKGDYDGDTISAVTIQDQFGESEQQRADAFIDELRKLQKYYGFHIMHNRITEKLVALDLKDGRKYEIEQEEES